MMEKWIDPIYYTKYGKIEIVDSESSILKDLSRNEACSRVCLNEIADKWKKKREKEEEIEVWRIGLIVFPGKFEYCVVLDRALM